MARSWVGQGIGLIVFGLFLTIAGYASYAACSSFDQAAARVIQVDCGPGVLVAVVGVLLLLLGIGLIVFSRRSYTYLAPPTDPSVPPPLINPVVVQQTLEREVVKVRCRYCGTLCDVDAGRCTGCGAPL